MNQMDLIEKIKKIREQAEIDVQEYIRILEEKKSEIEAYHDSKILSISYRIKDIDSILEKIQYLKIGNEEYTDLEILHALKDIIGITVEVESEDDYDYISEGINNVFNKENIFKSFENRRIYADTTKTGYSAIQQYYFPENKSILEIQIADKENIEIRNNTHEEFKEIKYMKVRNPEKFKQISEENERIRKIQSIEKLISNLKIKSMRAEYKGDISAEQYKEAYKKIELIQKGNNKEAYESILKFVNRIR